MTKLSIKKFKLAMKGSYGVQSIIAKKCDVERMTITNFLDRNPEMRVLLEMEREKIIDVAENRLHTEVNSGKPWAIKKVLDSVGKKRGYVETQQVELSGNVSTLSKEEREAEIKRLLKE